jgi:OMF family outer membrane factor
MDLTLPEAIRLALDHSYEVKSAIFDSSSTRYNYSASKSRRFPTLALSARAYQISDLIKVETLPGGLEIGSHDNYQLDARISVPLYSGGRISSHIKADRAAWTASTFDLKAAQMQTAYICRKAWLNVLLAGTQVAAAEVSRERINIIKNNVYELHKGGLADSIDILEAALSYEQSLLNLQKFITEENIARINLATLLGFDISTIIDCSDSLLSPVRKMPQYSDVTVGMETINRPELSSLTSRIEMSRQLINIKKSSFFPEINGYGGYSIGKPNRDLFGKSRDDYFSAGLNLNWTFNLGGRTGKEVNTARNDYFSIRAKHDRLKEKFLLDAQTALERLYLSYRAFLISRDEYKITAGKFELAAEKQKAGNLTINRLLEMEAELTAAEHMHRASIIDFYLAETEFLYATGSAGMFGGL